MISSRDAEREKGMSCRGREGRCRGEVEGEGSETGTDSINERSQPTNASRTLRHIPQIWFISGTVVPSSGPYSKLSARPGTYIPLRIAFTCLTRLDEDRRSRTSRGVPCDGVDVCMGSDLFISDRNLGPP